MPVDAHIIGSDEDGSLSETLLINRDKAVGPVVYTKEYNQRTGRTKPFLNPIYGNALNQAAGFSGVPVLINNGGDTAAWTGAGAASWNFADTLNPFAVSACVSATSANNLDSATFTGTSITGSSYTAITMELRLDTFSVADHSINLQFALAGVLKGVAVDISSVIDSSVLSVYQKAVISLDSLGIASETFDEAIITIGRSGGSKPTFRLDNWQIEEQGGVILFVVQPDSGTTLYIEKVRMTFVNNVTGNAAKNYNDLLGITMANGLTINRTSNGAEAVGRNLATSYELHSSGFDKVFPIQDDGTNSMLCIEIAFTQDAVLKSKTGDQIAIGVQDDLSGYLLASAIARGEDERDK